LEDAIRVDLFGVNATISIFTTANSAAGDGLSIFKICFDLSKPYYRVVRKSGEEERQATPVEVKKESILAMKKNIWRAVIEVGFIIFLFYSNLLMGEFERSGIGQERGLVWAIGDVFTAANFAIATIAALVGYILFEFLRKRF
jgi:hypothetical protein